VYFRTLIKIILKRIYLYTIILFTLLFNLKSYSQEFDYKLNSNEIILKGLFDSLFTRDSTRYLKNDIEKTYLNDTIQKLFFQTLIISNSLSYPFDSLKHIGKLYSNDKKIRVITWNTKFKDGSFKYYGFVQFYNQKKNTVITSILIDKSDSITNPENVILSNTNWFGVLYYQMHEYTDGGKKYYVLFGWDGNSYYTNKKIIDILSFNNSGKPIFGKSVFKTEKKTQKRMIFEHSLKTSMTCKFNKDIDAIVFDHLSPPKPSQKGQYQFYGPDGSYDGFRLEKGKWIFVSDIYVTNPKTKKKKENQK
jgi:hypothetical protein